MKQEEVLSNRVLRGTWSENLPHWLSTACLDRLFSGAQGAQGAQGIWDAQGCQECPKCRAGSQHFCHNIVSAHFVRLNFDFDFCHLYLCYFVHLTLNSAVEDTEPEILHLNCCCASSHSLGLYDWGPSQAPNSAQVWCNTLCFNSTTPTVGCLII